MKSVAKSVLPWCVMFTPQPLSEPPGEFHQRSWKFWANERSKADHVQVGAGSEAQDHDRLQQDEQPDRGDDFGQRRGFPKRPENEEVKEQADDDAGDKGHGQGRS